MRPVQGQRSRGGRRTPSTVGGRLNPRISTVSIVIPAYNLGRYLAEAIDSVLGQDYPHVELMVVDDGSSDQTAEVLHSYGPSIIWWTQPNAGQAAALNAGWGRASGEILAYLSADDSLAASAVSNAVRVLDADRSVACTYSDYKLVDRHSRLIRTVRTKDQAYRRLVENVECVIGPGAFFRKSLFAQVGGWSEEFRQSPDLDYWLRAGLAGEFRRIPETLATFRVHEQSQSYAVGDPARADEAIAIVDRFFSRGDLPQSLLPHRRRARAFARLMAARNHVRDGRYRIAVRKTLDAAMCAPATLLSRRAAHLLLNAFFNRAGHRAMSWLRGSATVR